MRLRSSLVLLSSLCAAVAAFGQTAPPAAPTCADLHLVPAVRECTGVESVHAPDGVMLVSPSRDEADAGTASNGQITVKTLRNDSISKDNVESDGFTVRELSSALGAAVGGDAKAVPIFFLRSGDSLAKQILRERNLAFAPQMHEEGYLIVPYLGRGLAVVAETSTGLFYAAQTIKQLIRGSGKDAVLLVPTIRDWPAMAHRGLSDDWSRGPMPNMDFLKREIRTLAAYKYNIFSPYFEHTFAYASSPVAAIPGGSMTPAEGRELVEYAAQYHIVIIPEQESFGHLHHMLKFEEFAPLAETAHGSVLAPGDPATLPLIGSWFSELAAVFPGPWAHVGADETFELGQGRTRDTVTKQGLGAVYLDFLSRIHAQLEPNHKQLLFWGDVAVNSPELVGTLPKDMIAVPWDYDAKPDFKPIILPFTKAGLETWVAPGVNNWNRMYPNNNEALGNIRAFVRDGQALGSKGMLNTVWNDDGEGLFDQNWFGVLFGAAAGWQVGESSEDNFVASFGQAFHRDETGKISQAHREIMAVHAALRKAGLYDAQDKYFWVDPFSPDGRLAAEMIRPVVSEVRLHAERAITLVAEARAAGKLQNEEALEALELGARRIDFMGLKFQAADETVALYAQARVLAADKTRWNEVSTMLGTIGDNNGKLEDMRDGYTLTRDMYQKIWLRDNRPYWLQNNLARYDLATQLWVGRSDRWHRVVDRWWETHTLPAPEEVGLPAK